MVEPDNIVKHVPRARGGIAARLNGLRNAIFRMRSVATTQQVRRADFLKPAVPWQGVLPQNVTHKSILAMDGAGIAMDDAGFMTGNGFGGDMLSGMGGTLGLYGQEGLGFLGYGVLAELSQRTEYRRLVEIISEEMVRKFIRITSSSNEDQGVRIRLMHDAMEKFHLRKVFRRLAEVDGTFGRAHLFIDVRHPGGSKLSDEELASPLILTPETVPLHCLFGFKVIEPFWTYPAQFNGMDPVDDNFYNPEHWYVMGKKYHRTRMIPFVNRPVPDIMKPSFSFGGTSLIQLAKPYIDNFVRTRQNVAQVVETFSQQVLQTSMDAVMDDDAAQELDLRVELYNAVKSTRGVMVMDKDTEDLKNVVTPLSGLEQLQAQALEFICSSVAVPLVKYTGIQPAGLNASSDGEIRTFYDATEASRSRFFDPHLPFILDLIMLSELGVINKDISHAWEPLWSASEAEIATIRKTNADTAQVYIAAGVLDPQEERERLANEEDGLYVNVDPDKLPKPAQEEQPNPDDPLADNNDDEKDNDPDAPPAQEQPDNVAVPVVGQDKEFDESKHPRANNGEFGSGGGGAAPAAKAKPSATKAPASAGKGATPAAAGKATSYALTPVNLANGKRVLPNGKPLPAHVPVLPPAWRDVRISLDPSSPLVAQGKDAKGKTQSIYSVEHTAKQAAIKFARVKAVTQQLNEIVAKNDANKTSPDARKRDAAHCLALVMATGIRPGSETDTGARKQAYGATTLQGQHVVNEGGKTFLRFVGKSGKNNNLPITDAGMAKELNSRAKEAGATGQIFPNLNDANLRGYTKSVVGAKFKTKDFRTNVGTSTAIDTIRSMPAPTDAKSYKAAVTAVAKAVSAKLGNTPAVALQSYIAPEVFSEWAAAKDK